MPTEGASLGGDGNQLNVSWNLFNKTVCSEFRNVIVNTINKMLKLNGIDTEIVLKPLDFNLVDVDKEETTPQIKQIGFPVNKITEEKVVNDEQD